MLDQVGRRLSQSGAYVHDADRVSVIGLLVNFLSSLDYFGFICV